MSSKDFVSFHVMCSIKLDNDWNEWNSIPGFSLIREHDTDPRSVARDACMIVHHERTRKVQVQVYNPETKLYDLRYEFDPITF